MILYSQFGMTEEEIVMAYWFISSGHCFSMK